MMMAAFYQPAAAPPMVAAEINGVRLSVDPAFEDLSIAVSDDVERRTGISLNVEANRAGWERLMQLIRSGAIDEMLARAAA